MEIELQNKPLFSLSIAAELLAVHPRTLMFYEKEKLIKPARTNTGRRLFSKKDLSSLQFIRYLAEKKRVNTAGIRIILSILGELDSSNPKARQEFFADFKEQNLI
ncbi:hypothetical protein A2696_03055 [Candidatus Curtissbacteria bacterium RIFCSPHIGHO2_01_FULL_41_13]|uniref:HTH merR-type domain-containing protein n=1 Tax=Candidatus Curtissbacteria bacterium RIFCSPHIGHO2_01_FULL_41_13 TaxID=1797745 RepID=A0A1F5G0P5_9BACT|nr:MAG: hypothetical protein A2696_03055 [Candidatus Curtissbacteria bacterium RIFCSPHIGHO2_01_FULL_41_13]